RALLPDGTGFTHQHQESRLESVLRVVLTGQDPATQTPNHGTVPPQKGFKGRPIPTTHETLQQLAIAHRCGITRAKAGAQVVKDQSKGFSSHGTDSCKNGLSSLL